MSLPQIPGYAPATGIAQPIGRGGAADVYAYVDCQGLPYAVKISFNPFGGDSEERLRYVTETEALSKLNHPNILRIYHAGLCAMNPNEREKTREQPASNPDGTNYYGYMVLQYAPGGSLSSKKPLPLPLGLSMGIQLCGALETVHRARIVHRDIKPSNILLDANRTPLLSDFGIAALGDYKLDQTGGYSVPWAAPELLAGTSVGNRSTDVYSLGATISALLTGRSPFELLLRADSNALNALSYAALPTREKTAVLRRAIQEARKAPDFAALAGIPPALSEALRTAMAPEPDARYSSALEFGRALQKAQAELLGSYSCQTPITVAGERPTLPSPQELAAQQVQAIAQRKQAEALRQAAAAKAAKNARRKISPATKKKLLTAGIVAATVLALAGGSALWAAHSHDTVRTGNQTTLNNNLENESGTTPDNGAKQGE